MLMKTLYIESLHIPFSDSVSTASSKIDFVLSRLLNSKTCVSPCQAVTCNKPIDYLLKSFKSKGFFQYSASFRNVKEAYL